MIRSAVKFSGIILTAFFIGACSQGGSSTSSSSIAEWTIFVYGHADHNLSTSMAVDLREMELANLSSKVNVIAAIDYDSSRKKADNVTNYPSGTHVYEILGNGNSQVIETYPEQNFDDMQVLESLAVKAFKRYPSKRKAMILWNHGGAWKDGYGGDTQNGSIQYPTGVKVSQIKQTAQSILKQVGANKFNFLAFDTCLMGNIEVVYELKDLADVYFASAELDFGPGWDYTAALNTISAQPTADIKSLAPDIIAGWDAHHRTSSIDETYLRTQVAIDNSKIQSMGSAYSDFVTDLKNSSASTSRVAQLLWRSSPTFGSGVDWGLNYSTSYRDVGHFLGLIPLAGDTNLTTSSQALLSKFSGAIIASTLGDQRKDVQIGLSIEGSIGSTWTFARKAFYDTFAWAGSSRWGSVIDSIREQSDLDPDAPSVSTTITNNTNPSSSNLPKVSFSVTDSDADQALVSLYQISGGRSRYLGFLGHGFVEMGQSYDFEWSGKRYEISNGTTSSPAAIEFLSLPGEKPNGDTIGGFYSIRGKLFWAGKSYTAYLIASPTDNGIDNINIVDPSGRFTSTDSVRNIAAAGDAVFTPQLISVPVGGGTRTLEDQTPIPIAVGTTELLIQEVSASAGSYSLGTVIRDVWGKAGAASDPVTVVTPF